MIGLQRGRARLEEKRMIMMMMRRKRTRSKIGILWP
jgi:hypothetical protein